MKIFSRTRPLRWALALALALPLLCALAPQASAHGYRPASSARLHFAHTPRARVATYRRPHRFYVATRRHLAHRVAAMPAMRFQPGGASSIVAEAMRFVGAGNVTGMRGAWCADYASMILRRTGHRALAGRSVSAAFAYGPRVRQPKPGDLVVVNTRRGYAQHVGFFAGWQNGQIMMVSGNWGHRVSRALLSRGAVAAFIRV